jgi:hypothetical protein
MIAGLTRDGEGVCDALVDLFRGAEFAAMLRQVWEERQHGIPFVLPGVVYSEERQTPDQYPCGEVILMDDEPGTVNVGVRLTIHVAVQWSFVGDDEDVMDRTVKRYLRATRMLLTDRTMQPYFSSSPVRCGRGDYSLLSNVRPNAGINARYLRAGSLDAYVETFA